MKIRNFLIDLTQIKSIRALFNTTFQHDVAENMHVNVLVGIMGAKGTRAVSIAHLIRSRRTRRTKGATLAEMTAEAKAARAAYMRDWRKRNPDKQREYEARKWQRVADREAEKEAAPCPETTSD